MALIKGKPEPWSNSITSYLHESKALIVYSSNDPESGQLATTHYKILKSRKEFTILKVWLETGRKNQIRVHLRDIGFPIVGDKKYGSEIDPIGRLGLHAWILNFKHPITGELMEFKTDIPRKFARLV
jgi:23S rRNA pseudouridine1911/1915/1917 synthase